jgi:hypothetical protein
VKDQAAAAVVQAAVKVVSKQRRKRKIKLDKTFRSKIKNYSQAALPEFNNFSLIVCNYIRKPLTRNNKWTECNWIPFRLAEQFNSCPYYYKKQLNIFLILIL